MEKNKKYLGLRIFITIIILVLIFINLFFDIDPGIPFILSIIFLVIALYFNIRIILNLKKYLILTLIFISLSVFIILDCLYFPAFGFKTYLVIREGYKYKDVKIIESYSYSSGGFLYGGHYRTVIFKYKDKEYEYRFNRYKWEINQHFYHDEEDD